MLLRRTCWLTLPSYMEPDTNFLLIAPVSTGSVLVNTAAREEQGSVAVALLHGMCV